MSKLFTAIITMFIEFTMAITGLGKLASTAVSTTQNVADVVHNMSVENKLTKEIFAQMRLDAIASFKANELTAEEFNTKVYEINQAEVNLGNAPEAE